MQTLYHQNNPLWKNEDKIGRQKGEDRKREKIGRREVRIRVKIYIKRENERQKERG